MKSIVLTAGSIMVIVFTFLPGGAAASTSSELKALREEVQALREGQQDMQKELEEIKKLLQQGARAAPGQQAFKPTDLKVGNSPTMGFADAPVTLVEFSDYQCPFCKRHADTVMPDLLKQYVETGRVRFVMREFPIENIHPRAMDASKAALCARDQGKYWEMSGLLFANQKALALDELKAHAVTLGLDMDAFNACLESDRHLAEIRAAQGEAQKMGISGTPSFVIGLTDKKDPNTVHLTKFVRGAQALPVFQQNLDELLKEADAAE